MANGPRTVNSPLVTRSSFTYNSSRYLPAPTGLVNTKDRSALPHSQLSSPRLNSTPLKYQTWVQVRPFRIPV